MPRCVDRILTYNVSPVLGKVTFIYVFKALV
jgi:hypothetical protein